ncbi:hypothetical protein BX070DRAFT_48074 [Coemansia spiralis]|nr:hypothetical protein BX070DRAFT_48074 [Coemansia spiralis]
MHKGHFYSAAVFALEIAFYSQIAQVLGESQWLRLKWMLLCAPPMAARVLVSAWPHRLTLCALLPLIPALLVLLATHNVPAHLVFHKTSPATILIAVDIYLLARQLLALLHLSVARITYLWVFRYLRGETGPQPPTIDPEELLGRFSTQLDAERRRAEPLLARAIVRTFAFDLCASSALQLAVYASQVVLPVLVARILFQLGRLDTAMPDALFALAAYATVALAAAVVEQNQIDHRDKVALKMQVALSAAVHRAAVRGSTLEDPLCGTDHPQALSAHVAKLCGNIWLPLRVVSGLYVFYRQVGWAVLPGIAFILVYLPIRSHLIRARTAAQAASTRASGERTRMLAQMLENIVPLRLLGWDARLRMDIERLREGAELRHTVASSVANALLALARTASRSGGPLVSLAIYSVLRHFSDTEFVTTEKVYIVQSILRELFPLLIDIPHAFDSWWAARLPHEQLARVLFAAPAEAASKMEWPSLAAAGQMVAVVGAWVQANRRCSRRC